MTKAELEKLAEKHQAKADADYLNYQETGITRYDTSRRKNEDMADAFRMAAAAADEHHAYIAMKGQMANFVWRAKMASDAETEEKRDELVEAILRDLVSYGVLQGMIRRD